MGKMTYKDAGVDTNSTDEFVSDVKKIASETSRLGVMGNIGGFAGLYDCKALGLQDPVLAMSTDGVGTKLLVAQEMGKHDTIGIDLVAMCVNDLITHGARPFCIFRLSCNGKFDPSIAKKILTGIKDGCNQAGVALLGGETAEMPGMYTNKQYDLAGFAIGAVERSKVLPSKDSISAGDVVIGLTSSGVHANGYSLAREILKKHNIQYDSKIDSPFLSDKDCTWGEALLTPTKIYVEPVLAVSHLVKSIANITGGGLMDNINRVLPEDLEVELYSNLEGDLNHFLWPVADIFKALQSYGEIDSSEMYRVFNCGIGMVLIADPSNLEEVTKKLASYKEDSFVIGQLSSK